MSRRMSLPRIRRSCDQAEPFSQCPSPRAIALLNPRIGVQFWWDHWRKPVVSFSRILMCRMRTLGGRQPIPRRSSRRKHCQLRTHARGQSALCGFPCSSRTSRFRHSRLHNDPVSRDNAWMELLCLDQKEINFNIAELTMRSYLRIFLSQHRLAFGVNGNSIGGTSKRNDRWLVEMKVSQTINKGMIHRPRLSSFLSAGERWLSGDQWYYAIQSGLKWARMRRF